MKKEYHLNLAKQYIKQIDNLSNVDFYVNNRARRNDLASLYKQIMNIGSMFPERDRTMTNHVAGQLHRKVSRTCPSCVKPQVMQRHVTDAIKALKNYSVKLVKFVDDDKIDEHHESVHDMRPTTKKD